MTTTAGFARREQQGPYVTGDPEIDEFEREIWEQQQAQRQERTR